MLLPVTWMSDSLFQRNS